MNTEQSATLNAAKQAKEDGFTVLLVTRDNYNGELTFTPAVGLIPPIPNAHEDVATILLHQSLQEQVRLMPKWSGDATVTAEA